MLGQNDFNTNINIMQDKEQTKNKRAMYKALAKIIQKHREAQNKSIYELAAVCSMSTNSWNRIEKGISLDPSFTTIWKIAEALDIYPDELLREVREKLGDDFSLSDLK